MGLVTFHFPDVSPMHPSGKLYPGLRVPMDEPNLCRPAGRAPGGLYGRR